MSEDEPWLTPTQLYAWMQLTGAITQLPAVIDTQLRRDAGLNFFEYSILAGLSGAPHRAMKMATLAQMANGSQSRLSHAVSRLEKAGWVERRNCGDGSRSVEAVLTDTGYEKITEAAPHHVREVRRMVVDALSEEELGQLRHALRKILLVASPETVQFLDETFAESAHAPPE
ncbi:MarR family winged helix-turn-helix transcriptional regulator [Streptomyces iconiensis]|uniref:MarR family winged helix-turn-helix transcriptional regulator n=1 Tax=Streptomyces iconiensis TaxID=1384038 RepID=A0ABT7A157_9ACTN|nr:MarR family winged helix-turn-helix transcriptional regulator [Streptomyces iconiensis]MDJ1135055.1 MarR family winged helix-turn-helix transcriptional regulator [Streptomyces iconiensis]